MNADSTLAIGILVASIVVIFSYLVDIFSHRIRIPSVLLLMAFGMGIKVFLDVTGIGAPDFTKMLPFLGTIGLILIVLEAAMHLHLTRDALEVMSKAAISAASLLLVTSGVITGLLHLVSGETFHSCLVNAIPFAVISSAMAIPSAQNLSPEKKEFVIYESTFSDILGILFFTLASNNLGGVDDWVLGISKSVLITILFSAIFTVGLVWLVTKLRNHVKFFLILFLLLLVYSVAKLFHLPALLLVFLFGLALNNTFLLNRWKWLSEKIDLEKVQEDLKYMQVSATESTFLIRTFFFVIFGYSLQWALILKLDVILLSLAVAAIIFGLRFGFFKLLAKKHLFPEFLIAPRGLITVLLFYSIPQDLQIGSVNLGSVFLVVVVTAITMAAGTWKKRQS
ncbi:MAG TPA: cation:proton antiporter [Fibrobacteraceae bacterium]|nr:cation:proton antiporter [Fibrobacteraceae bacterium]